MRVDCLSKYSFQMREVDYDAGSQDSSVCLHKNSVGCPHDSFSLNSLRLSEERIQPEKHHYHICQQADSS